MLTYSLPPELVSKVDANAAKERLSRANMIEVWLGEILGAIAKTRNRRPDERGSLLGRTVRGGTCVMAKDVILLGEVTARDGR